MEKVLCPCRRCVACHPAYKPTRPLGTVRNHCSKYGIDSVVTSPKQRECLVHIRNADDVEDPGGDQPEEVSEHEQDVVFVEGDERDDDQDHDTTIDDEDHNTTTEDDSAPSEKRPGRPHGPQKVLNRVALEVILDNIRKHNLTDACANDLLLSAQMETRIFSETVKTVASAERILSRGHVHVVCS